MRCHRENRASLLVSSRQRSSQSSSSDLLASVPEGTPRKREEVRYQKLATLLKHFGAVLEMALAAKPTPVEPGVRVIRGPDWKWGDQDGGEGHLGTVVQVGSDAPGEPTSSGNINPKYVVSVQWDNGTRSNYRIGYENAFDLKISDNAPMGVRHPGITCLSCKQQDFFGFRWRSMVDGVDLCNPCYMSDKLDTSHPYRRYDTPDSSGSVEVLPRSHSRKIQLRGILPGARVVRGNDWVWEDQDGGDGSLGQVVDIEGWAEDTERSVAKVYWPSKGQSHNYRVGHRGKVDLKCTGDILGYGETSYPDHLPTAGHPDAPSTRSAPPPSSPFNIGDWVKINVSVDSLKQLQQDHGGYNTKMSRIVGIVGFVHRITGKGDVRVQYPGEPADQFRWTINPKALVKTTHPSEGDSVWITDELNLIQEKQVGHGEWDDSMIDILGKVGTVVKVFADGMVRVNVRSHTWSLHPDCLTQVPKDVKVEMKTGLNRVGSSKENSGRAQFIKDCELGRVDAVVTYIQSIQQDSLDLKTIRKGLKRAACQGSLPVIKYLVEMFPDQADLKCEGKTPLLAAVHQGHLDVVDYLLTSGQAKLNTTDDDGDQALHYAAFGKQATVMEFILEREGHDINALNAKRCSALHVSVILGLPDCVESLLRRHALVNLKEAFGDTALHEAISQGNDVIFDMLIQVPELDLTMINVRGFNTLQLAALKGNVHAIQGILHRSPEMVAIPKDDGFTPLHIACVNGHLEAVKALLGADGCIVNAKDVAGHTPLHKVCQLGFYRITELLLCSEGRAEIGSKDLNGNTPLHLVLACEDELSMRLGQPMDVDVATLGQVKVALVKETLQKRIALALLLILNGASANVRNKQGHTPLDRVQDPASRSLIFEKAAEYSRESESIPTPSPMEESLPQAPLVPPQAKEESEPVECAVCSEMVQPCLFLPCGHKVTCGECSQRMKKCIECKEVINQKVICHQASRADTSFEDAKRAASSCKDLMAKVQYLEDQVNCSICMERKRNVVFLCGHSSCGECAETLKCCHMCRKPINKTINMY